MSLTTATGEICGNRYNPQPRPGDRIVHCQLAVGHDGDHEETDTGNTWAKLTDLIGAWPDNGINVDEYLAEQRCGREHTDEAWLNPILVAITHLLENSACNHDHETNDGCDWHAWSALLDAVPRSVRVRAWKADVAAVPAGGDQ